METLRAKLAASGIDVRNLKTLREVVTHDHVDLARLPTTLVEKRFPIYTLPTAPETALILWESLWQLTAQTEHYPVILGGRGDLGSHWELREDAKFPEEYLKQAQDNDAKQWFRKFWAEELASGQGDPEVADYFAEEWDERARPLLTLKPDTLFYRHKREKAAQQYIGFFPTMISWQTPAYLCFGGWNACPPSAIHCALHRYWQSIYHTEIVMMSSDIICCRVGKPIESRENALELAKEQYAYCGDLVSQGTGTIGNLASGLIHSAYWLFWWD